MQCDCRGSWGWLQQNKCCLAFTPEALTSLQGISPAKASIKIGRGETKDEVADPNRYRDQDQSQDPNMDQGFAFPLANKANDIFDTLDFGQ